MELSTTTKLVGVGIWFLKNFKLYQLILNEKLDWEI